MAEAELTSVEQKGKVRGFDPLLHIFRKSSSIPQVIAEAGKKARGEAVIAAWSKVVLVIVGGTKVWLMRI